MHEAAVCREIMDIVGRSAKENGIEKVYDITICAGPYSCIHEDMLNFYFDIAKQDTCMSEGAIRIERDEALDGPGQVYVKSFSGD